MHLDPNNVEARLALSELYKAVGNYEAAIAIVSHNSISGGTFSSFGVKYDLFTCCCSSFTAQQEQHQEHIQLNLNFDPSHPNATSVQENDLASQDAEWCDVQHIKMIVQKGLLYYSLDQHKEFLDTGFFSLL